MKRKLLIALALSLSLHTQAQLSFEADPNYGRLQDITYDPLIKNRLYAVSNGGNHILISEDNKLSWSILYSFPDTGARISQLKLLSGNTAMSFMVTNTGSTADLGVYICNISSGTIINHYRIPNPEDNPNLMSYDVYDASGAHVMLHEAFADGIVGALRTKVMYTPNSGQNWNTVYDSNDYDFVHVNKVVFSPVNPDKLFIARSFGLSDIDGGFLISSDAGETWTQHLPGIMLDPIAFHPGDANDIIIGTGIAGNYHPENLYRTKDGGATWEILANDWNFTNGYNNINKICINPLDPNNILALEEDVVAVTYDGGVTWANTIYEQNDDNRYYAGLHGSFNPFVAGEVIISTPYYPQFSTNGGVNLSQLKVPFYNVISVSSTVANDQGHLYFGAQGGRVHKNLSTGVSNSTEILNSFEFNPPKHYVFADALVPGRMFSFGGGGFMGGNFNLNTNYDSSTLTIMSAFADDVRAVAVDPSNTSIVYASFRNGEGSSLFKIDFSDLDNIQNVAIITPGVDDEGLGNGVVTGIAVSPTHSQTLYIVQRDKFYKSTDGGASWEEKSNGIVLEPHTIIWDLTMNPFNENEFAIATDNGIFTTIDNGDSWVHTYDQPVHRIKYSPSAPGLIAAGIRKTAALLYSLNNGGNWTAISPEQLKYLAAQSIDFNFIGNTIDAYIATSDLGVVKYSIQNLPLGIDSPESGTNSLKIYPNPSSGIVSIQLGDDLTLDSVSVFSVTGQKILTTHQSIFDVSDWNKGIYIVKAITTNGNSITQKLIKD